MKLGHRPPSKLIGLRARHSSVSAGLLTGNQPQRQRAASVAIPSGLLTQLGDVSRLTDRSKLGTVGSIGRLAEKQSGVLTRGEPIGEHPPTEETMASVQVASISTIIAEPSQPTRLPGLPRPPSPTPPRPMRTKSHSPPQKKTSTTPPRLRHLTPTQLQPQPQSNPTPSILTHPHQSSPILTQLNLTHPHPPSPILTQPNSTLPNPTQPILTPPILTRRKHG